MGTVARPLSAEQELATQQVQLAHPPSSDHTTAQHHHIIATVSPRYQHNQQQQGRSSEPRSHWPLLVSSLVLRAAHQVTLFAASLPITAKMPPLDPTGLY